MEIGNHIHPSDGASRRRGTEPAKVTAQSAGSASGAGRSDGVEVAPDVVARLAVQASKPPPSDAGRIADLKARIADGSYTATPEELADLILGRGTPADGR